LRSIFAAALLMASTAPALAIDPYQPLPLKPAELVAPPEDFIADVSAFLAAIKSGDGDAIQRGMASKITAIDGALDLHVRRHQEVIGPHAEIENLLSELADFIGGIVQEPEAGGDPRPLRIEAEREYIAAALSDDQTWGRDPMVKGAICSYAYRSFDIKAIKQLSDATGVASSSFVYVNAPTELKATPADNAPAAGTLETDRLYALDYDTDAPRRWMAIYLPDGSSGFVNFDRVELEKPYAAGVCFDKNADGHWVMVAQVSTSL
jgi:hypothetical protein